MSDLASRAALLAALPIHPCIHDMVRRRDKQDLAPLTELAIYASLLHRAVSAVHFIFQTDELNPSLARSVRDFCGEAIFGYNREGPQSCPLEWIIIERHDASGDNGESLSVAINYMVELAAYENNCYGPIINRDKLYNSAREYLNFLVGSGDYPAYEYHVDESELSAKAVKPLIEYL